MLLKTVLYVAIAGVAAAQSVERPESYLPLASGAKWVLKNPRQGTPAVFEVVEKKPLGYKIRSSHPWGSSEWTLTWQGEGLAMTEYGQGGPMMPLDDRPIYFDFGQNQGGKWKNRLGEFVLESRNLRVSGNRETFENCIQIRHKSGNLVFAFAKGVGFVQFGEGGSAFVLDRSESLVPGAAPSPRTTRRDPATDPAVTARQRGRNTRGAGRPSIYFGLTPNKFANEQMTIENMTNRFQQTVDAGSTFFVANGEWAQLEPREGQYKLDSINQTISVTAPANLRLFYTLRVVNTIYRDVPKDLARTSWSDPKMKARLFRLLEQISGPLKPHTDWFVLGYEIDGYFEKHPGEFNDFVSLHREATEKIKQLIPGVKVSSTLAFSTGLHKLEGPLAAMNDHLDFLALTYTPLRPDFSVEEPSAIHSDFAKMKQAAKGRKIVFQEIAYPTASVSRGSEDKQAEFYRLAFAEFAKDPGAFDAVNFMNLADLSEDDARGFTEFYGLKLPAFKGTLQTLGVFDQQGKPKKAWNELTKGMRGKY
jgi:hypothetical protein